MLGAGAVSDPGACHHAWSWPHLQTDILAWPMCAQEGAEACKLKVKMSRQIQCILNRFCFPPYEIRQIIAKLFLCWLEVVRVNTYSRAQQETVENWTRQKLEDPSNCVFKKWVSDSQLRGYQWLPSPKWGWALPVWERCGNVKWSNAVRLDPSVEKS